MKSKYILLFISLLFLSFSCVPRKYVYIQNKTDEDIRIFLTVDYNFGVDSVMNMILQKNEINSNTQQYQTILKPDSIAPLTMIYGEKSKAILIDTNDNHLNEQLLVVVSKGDTLSFNKNEIAQRINETWYHRNYNSPKKKKATDRSRLIWEFKGD